MSFVPSQKSVRKSNQNARAQKPEYKKWFDRRKRKQEKIEEQKNAPTKTKLPIHSMKKDILKTVNDNQVVVLSGPTGCGKSTQVPQFLLEESLSNHGDSAKQIVAAQPRKLAAMSVSKFVAEQQGEPFKPFEKRENRENCKVGYQVKSYYCPPREKGSILFCTTGTIFHMIRQSPTLTNVSHILLDEVHERDLFTDTLIGVIKDILKIRKDLRLILMSASMEVGKFTKYFDDAPHLEIPAKPQYPVEHFFLEDILDDIEPEKGYLKLSGLESYENYYIGSNNDPNDQQNVPAPFGKGSDQTYEEYCEYVDWYGTEMTRKILSIEWKSGSGGNQQHKPGSCRQSLDQSPKQIQFLKCIVNTIRLIHEDPSHDDKDRSILVFLPGLEEITILWHLINESGEDSPFWIGNDIATFALHSRMDLWKQGGIFLPAENKYMRKVILSTSLAETAITIDDVVYVVDCGRMNVARYAPDEKATDISTEWLRESNFVQKTGRAGRVQHGKIWHLYSGLRRINLKLHLEPELQRSCLERIVLNLRSLELKQYPKIATFLNGLMDPPVKEHLDDAVQLLIEIEALTLVENNSREALTRLGTALSKINLHPQLGKMLLYGVLMRCVNPILAIVSVLDDKDPYELPFEKGSCQRDRSHKYFAGAVKSDHWSYAKLKQAYNRLRLLKGKKTAEDFCEEHGLNLVLMQDQYDKVGELRKFLTREKYVNIKNRSGWNNYNENSGNVKVVLGVVAAGLYPNVFETSGSGLVQIRRRIFEAGQSETRTEEAGGEPRLITSKSVNYYDQHIPDFAVYFNARKWQKDHPHVHECTVIDRVAVCVFTRLGDKERAKNSLSTEHMDNLFKAMFQMLLSKQSPFVGRESLIRFLPASS